MSSVVIRNLPEETHRALKAQAMLHGRSTEAEIRTILEAAVRPPQRVRLGSLLASIGREAGVCDQDIAALQTRDQTPAEPMSFE
ncbi:MULTISPECIES: FitA-like ribbon-helix-helix domain-containing protein [Acetobacteraceae]|uniref:Plasmid stabilization protein n=6 Tax=Acetobacteraceae TaxID=433 RepID=A0A1D8UZ46_9PROT|nr:MULTISPECIES: plasmid stabilization protein [Acetobacteraceae]AOX18891.1 plasmid stabilization protein [Kozakia baliensis]KDU97261.1 plasmid stabilization protein [Komagataeibacter rhaeticus AF1]MBV1825359.1 plasmid stabilization protein [Komagataeibacter oboediens]MBV1834940.1 plasmid stabilization protein [Novacetimonas pomaceti]MBY4640181.1 plasmid stabilization protein [Gluconacetobacter entanii]